MAGAGKGRGQNELKNKAMLVVRNITKQEVTNVIFPNGITIGTATGPFKNGFRVHGNAQVSGIVNAQGFKVNGQDLSFSTTPAIIVTSESESFTYGSRNPNEFPSPSNTKIFITQLGQTTTITAASITVEDASGSTVKTTVGSLVFQSELTPGNSYSQFTLTPGREALRPTYPLTVTVTHEGITTTKKINEVILPTLRGDFSFLQGSTSISSHGGGSHTVAANDLFITDDSLLTLSSLTGFSYVDGQGSNTGRMSLGANTAFAVAQDNTNVTSTSDTVDMSVEVARSLGFSFYRPKVNENVTIRRVGGRAIFVLSGASGSDAIQYILVLYKFDSSTKVASPVAEFTQINLSASVPVATVDFGADGTNNDITPFSMTGTHALMMGLFVKSTNMVSAQSISHNIIGFVEYSIDN